MHFLLDKRPILPYILINNKAQRQCLPRQPKEDAMNKTADPFCPESGLHDFNRDAFAVMLPLADDMVSTTKADAIVSAAKEFFAMNPKVDALLFVNRERVRYSVQYNGHYNGTQLGLYGAGRLLRCFDR